MINEIQRRYQCHLNDNSVSIKNLVIFIVRTFYPQNMIKYITRYGPIKMIMIVVGFDFN